MSVETAPGVNGKVSLEDLRRILAAAPAGGAFDRQARLAAAAVGAPAALLVAVNDQGEVWKGAFGLPGTVAALRDHAATLVPHLGSEPLTVANAANDPRFAGHRALTAAGLVALLAVPVSTSVGDLPAWLVVLDARPRNWVAQDIDLLREVGQFVLTELEALWLHGEVKDRTEEAKRLHRENDALLDGLPHGLFLLDPAGRIALCNHTAGLLFQQVSGRDPAQLIGMDVWQHCPEVADSVFAKEYRQAEREDRSFETEAYFPSLRRWFAFQGVRSGAGLCVAVQDVTERVRIEQSLRDRATELADSNLGKDEFLLQLAHELRNCLVPVRNALHLWGKLAFGDADEDGAREMAEAQLRHITGLLEDMLKLAHLAPRDLVPKLARLDLGEVVAQGMHAALAAPAARGRQFSINLPSEPLLLEADRDMLDKVLAHLLDNAVKFTRPGGHISLEVVREETEALLRIRDDGIGISAKLLPRIFTMFMRRDRSESPLQGGIGIGLALVRRLMEVHHGTVEARSEGPGRGTEFLVRLPALVNVAAAPESVQHMPILVVDDSQEAADSLALLLRLWGYEVRVAYDPQSGLEDARAHPPRVILLDIGMPGINGYELARRLRAQEESKGALMVAVTGYGAENDRRRAQEAGFDYHIVKPADPSKLLEILKAAGS